MKELAWLPGKFRPIRPLGKGGMGEVWLVEEIAAARPLACKFLLLELTDEKRELARLRFKREYRVLAQLTHPGLALAHELFETAGVIAYTMDYVAGWPLKDYFLAGHWAARASERHPDGEARGDKPEAPTPLYFTSPAGIEQVSATGAELLGMLSYLHGSGIIHRDLKPANLMVEKSGRLRMIDFGLARGEHEVIELTQVGEIMGTPNYIAPEQIRGQPLDGRSDLYSVGVILYELLTGKTPFSGPPAQVLMSHLCEGPRSPRDHNPLIPGPLSGFILRLLAKTPQARYATAGEARDGLLSAAGRSGNVEVTLPLQSPGPLVGRGLLLTTPYEGNHEAVAEVLARGKALHEQGHGSLTLLAGGAGSGKSRLLDELRGTAVERGMKFLRGACHEGSAGQLFYDIFQPLAEEMTRHPDRAARWLEQDGELLAHHYPALRQLPGLNNPRPPGLEAASARAQLMGAFYGFFSRLARDERVIIAAEDLHCADALTLELLAHLTRSFALTDAGQSPLAVVVNYRPEEIAAHPGLEQWLAGWKGERVARLRLKPLSAPDVARLISEALGDSELPEEATVAAICDLTGGNPFFVLELLRRGREEETRHAGGRWSLGRWLREEREVLPESLSAALKRRLADLGEKAAEPLEAAAILGRAFDFKLWQAVSGLPEDELFELAERAFKREVLMEAGADRLQFQHELFRRQLLQGISGMKQRRLHGKAARALIAWPDAHSRHGETIARHAVAAGMKPEAAAYGMAAVEGLAKTGEYERAWTLLEGVCALFTETDPMAPSEEIEWQRLRGVLLFRRGSAAEAALLLEQSRERLRGLPPGESRDRQELRILKGLANAYFRQGRYDARIQAARLMPALAAALGERADQADALRIIGMGLGHLGDLEGAEAHLALAETLLPKITDRMERLQLEGLIANGRSLMELDQGRMATAALWAVRALETAQARDDRGTIAVFSGNLGEFELQLGRLAAGKARLESARMLNEAIGSRGVLADNLNSLALCALHEDRPEEAESLLRQSLLLAGETARRNFAALAGIHLARLVAEKGDREQALALLDEAASAADEIHNPAIQAKAWAARAALELRAGNRPAARSAAERAVEISAGRFLGDEALARTVAGAAGLREGISAVELSSCEGQLQQAIATALKLENVPLEFELRLIAADFLVAAQKPQPALDFIADLPHRAAALGFRRFADQARMLLAGAQKALSG